MAIRQIGKWWYSYHRNEFGRLITVACKTTDRESAEQFDADMHAQILHKRQKNQIVKYADPDLLDKLKKQDDERKRAKRLDGSAEHKRGTIRLDKMLDLAKNRHRIGEGHILAWNSFVKNSGYTFADEVTPKCALDYLEKAYGTGNGKTYNNNKSALNTIFRCCLIETGLEASPFASIMNKTVTNVEHHRNLTLQEIDEIMKNADPLIQVMVMLSRWTAQRLETCARITENMLDSERNVFVIDPGKTKRFGKWVCVPVFPALKKFLEQPEIRSHFPKDKDKPIVSGFGFRNQKSFSLSFGRLLDALNINDDESGTATFHSIRGTAITFFKEHGIRGEELRMITGHESAAVEDIYARDIATVSKIASNFPAL